MIFAKQPNLVLPKLLPVKIRKKLGNDFLQEDRCWAHFLILSIVILFLTGSAIVIQSLSFYRPRFFAQHGFDKGE